MGKKVIRCLKRDNETIFENECLYSKGRLDKLDSTCLECIEERKRKKQKEETDSPELPRQIAIPQEDKSIKVGTPLGVSSLNKSLRRRLQKLYGNPEIAKILNSFQDSVLVSTLKKLGMDAKGNIPGTQEEIIDKLVKDIMGQVKEKGNSSPAIRFLEEMVQMLTIGFDGFIHKYFLKMGENQIEPIKEDDSVPWIKYWEERNKEDCYYTTIEVQDSSDPEKSLNPLTQIMRRTGNLLPTIIKYSHQRGPKRLFISLPSDLDMTTFNKVYGVKLNELHRTFYGKSFRGRISNKEEQTEKIRSALEKFKGKGFSMNRLMQLMSEEIGLSADYIKRHFKPIIREFKSGGGKK